MSGEAKRHIAASVYAAILLLLIEVLLVGGTAWWWNLVNSHGHWNIVNRFFVCALVWCFCYACTNPGQYEE